MLQIFHIFAYFQVEKTATINIQRLLHSILNKVDVILKTEKYWERNLKYFFTFTYFFNLNKILSSFFIIIFTLWTLFSNEFVQQKKTKSHVVAKSKVQKSNTRWRTHLNTKFLLKVDFFLGKYEIEFIKKRKNLLKIHFYQKRR